MATASTAPIKGVSMSTQAIPQTSNQLRPDLEKIVETIVGLRQLTATTTYNTFKEQRAILDCLSSEDKATVGLELLKREMASKQQK